MAGYNSPFGSSASSILKGAQSAANKIAEYNDSLAAFEYENSAHTDDAFADYKQYLTGRISGLKGGDLTSQQKALTLTKTLESAYHANVSANIQRANIQIMAGGASLRDKYGLLSDQFSQAVANSDYTLAQSLESQAYSVSQQIQYEEQQAASAANSLAEASARAGARSESQLGDALKAKLEDFNFNYAHAGEKTANAMLGDFVKANAKTFEALGITLPKGVQPNYFDVVDGVNRAIYKAYSLAGDAVAPYAVDGGQSYYDKASSVVKSIATIYGTMNAQQLLQAQANASQYSYNTAPDFKAQGAGGAGGKQNPQVGYQYTPQGGVAPVYANSPWVDVPNSFKTVLDQLGLQVVGQAKNGGLAYEVHRTDKTPDYIKKVLPTNATTVAATGGNNLGTPGIQFEADAQNGTGKAVYTVTTDQSGKTAFYESSNLGDRLVNADPGYDKTFAPLAHGYTQSQVKPPASFFSNLVGFAKAGLSNFADAFGGNFGPSTLVANAQKTQADMARQQADDAAAAKLLAKPLQLPKLSLAAPPALPQIAVAHPKPVSALNVAKPAPLPVAQKTTTPQPASSLKVQGGGSSSSLLQGSGVNLQ